MEKKGLFVLNSGHFAKFCVPQTELVEHIYNPTLLAKKSNQQQHWLIQSHTAHSHWLAGWLTHGCVSVHVTLSTHLPSPPLSHGRTSVLYVCFSTAALEVDSSVPFF